MICYYVSTCCKVHSITEQSWVIALSIKINQLLYIASCIVAMIFAIYSSTTPLSLAVEKHGTLKIILNGSTTTCMRTKLHKGSSNYFKSPSGKVLLLQLTFAQLECIN